MRRAIDLAAKGAATTAPNPDVGAVVLSPAGDTLAEGFHERAGGPHAEVVALDAAGPLASGATLVVTLEPCSRRGRTGPCVATIRAAGVRRVVYAADDPTEAGGGADELRAAGIDVEAHVLEAEAEHGNSRWLTTVRRGRPWVVWKVATSLDGRVAAADGTSRWISSPASRADAHRLRSVCDTIMVGLGTVLADDPQLTVRDEEGAPAQRQPLRVVVDTAGRTPPDARIRDASAQTWVATAGEVGAATDGRVDLARLLALLQNKGRQSVLLEGGPTLAAAFVRRQLVDRVVVYVAPILLGAGMPALGELGVTTLGDAVDLDVLDVQPMGSDVRITAEPRLQEV